MRSICNLNGNYNFSLANFYKPSVNIFAEKHITVIRVLFVVVVIKKFILN